MLLKYTGWQKSPKVPCFSSSSLRWYPGVVEVANADVGELIGVLSYGPAPSEPNHPDLFWYGIHPTEALFTVMGTGCETDQDIYRRHCGSDRNMERRKGWNASWVG